jgi:hypothetical protein
MNKRVLRTEKHAKEIAGTTMKLGEVLRGLSATRNEEPKEFPTEPHNYKCGNCERTFPRIEIGLESQHHNTVHFAVGIYQKREL